MHKLVMLCLVALLLAGGHKAPAESATRADETAAAAKAVAADAKDRADARDETDAKGGGDAKDGANEKARANSMSRGDAKDAGGAGEGVALKPAEVEAMGIETTPAQTIQSAPEVQGFGVVLAHE